MIVSWFGSDLRAANCVIEPKVEDGARLAPALPWSVAGRGAAEAPEVRKRAGRPIYGGTPSDASVIEAIQATRARGLEVVYYPFILMDVLASDARPDPYSPGLQPDLPWRGRVTASKVAGQPGSPIGTAAIDAEVAAFFGSAQAAHFTVLPGHVIYAGPAEWRYRRFILHQAALCKAAGGVDAFCIGSEMRGLTQMRGQGSHFPAVQALRALAADVRTILGPETKITYAADWSEYFGLITAEGDRYFHLDPLWGDANIDAVAIDNYLPLSDWRDGDTHLDAAAGAVHDLDYLRANVAGGEGYDWFYASPQDRAAQIRTPITDASEWNEPWIWRSKDLRSWWENDHHDRVGGVRSATRSPWVPRAKPIWFTEYGCAAIDRGTNQPNVFLDPKSSESAVPHFSRGGRDDAMQMQYYRALHRHWSDPAHNPVSEVYGGRMLDLSRAHAWAWDARPYPWFPANQELWEDGANWSRGHWLSGRATAQPLDALITEICARAGVTQIDVSRVWGVVRGLALPSTDSPRAMLQALMLAYGIDAAERGGRLVFRLRGAGAATVLAPGDLVRNDDGDMTLVRAPQADLAGRVRLGYVAEGGAFDLRLAEAVFPDESAARATGSDLPLVLTAGEARHITERWLAEARLARDTLRFGLPASSPVGPGDHVALGGALWRIDRASLTQARDLEATRIDLAPYLPGDPTEDGLAPIAWTPPSPVQALFLDLPLWAGDTRPQVVLEALVARPAALGVTLDALARAAPGRWDRGPGLRVRMDGALASVPLQAVLDGANLLAIGTGERWELLQFAQADLVGPNTYELQMRLRGQFGTDADMPALWPAGAQVVVLDSRLSQLDLPLDALGLTRRYRIGAASRPLDDPSMREVETRFEGIGLRPYAPVHLRARALGGDMALSWTRREVPLMEERELYALRIRKEGALVREVQVDSPAWIYPAAAQLADGTLGGFVVEVAQISAVVGAGPATTLRVGA